HIYRSIEWKGNVLGILEMRRHYSNYLKGIPHIKEIRNQLVQKNNLDEIETLLEGLRLRAQNPDSEYADINLRENQLQAV
ncbi:MAG TPA: tRNA dihydrouridine synthase DusB, partial [Puia sp.]